MNDRSKINLAMHEPEKFVLRLVYVDDEGKKTRRYVSPVRYGSDRYRSLKRFSLFLGLCLCREEHRWFKVAGCQNIELVPAADVLMPAEIEEL